MRRLYIAGVSLLFLFSCNRNSKIKQVKEDPYFKLDTTLKYDSITGFWMDESEINSNEYRQYHFDSIQKDSQ